MLAVAFLPFVAFGLLALVPMLDTGEDEVIEDDVVIDDPDMEDPTGEEEEGDAPDGDAGEDPVDPDAEEPVAEDPDAEENPAATVVTITDSDGATRDVEVTEDDVVGDAPVDIDGSELRDVFVAPDEPTVAVRLNGFGGDDSMEFGYSTSVDPGEGVDVLDLTISQEALANGELEAGVVTFDDPVDGLVVEIEDDAVGFLHEVRVNASEAVDDDTVRETVTLFYILSPNEELGIDEEASAAAGRVIFEDGAQVIVEIDLGTETTTTVAGEDGAEPTEDVTGRINDDPTVVLNRDVTSTQTIDV